MAPEALLAVLIFAFVTSVTPGPNNFMLLASGVNFGFRRTLPHMIGISTGFASLVLGVGFGLGALLHAVPAFETGLKIAGGLYLLYLAWRIGMSRTMGSGGTGHARPMTLLEGAAFQWVNPKAWVMAVTAVAVYAQGSDPVAAVLAIVVAFVVAGFPAIAVWAGFGQALRGWLSDPVRLKWFNIAMGIALALTLVPMLA